MLQSSYMNKGARKFLGIFWKVVVIVIALSTVLSFVPYIFLR